MSFQCDGHVIKERRYHCCKVNGQLSLGGYMLMLSGCRERSCIHTYAIFIIEYRINVYMEESLDVLLYMKFRISPLQRKQLSSKFTTLLPLHSPGPRPPLRFKVVRVLSAWESSCLPQCTTQALLPESGGCNGYGPTMLLALQAQCMSSALRAKPVLTKSTVSIGLTP